MRKRAWAFALAGLLVSVLLAALVAPFASTAPDGLERVAQDQGFASKGEGAPAWRFALMPDYLMRRIGNKAVATALAGLAGTVLVFGVTLGVAKLVARKPKAQEQGRGGGETRLSR